MTGGQEERPITQTLKVLLNELVSIELTYIITHLYLLLFELKMSYSTTSMAFFKFPCARGIGLKIIFIEPQNLTWALQIKGEEEKEEEEQGFLLQFADKKNWKLLLFAIKEKKNELLSEKLGRGIFFSTQILQGADIFTQWNGTNVFCMPMQLQVSLVIHTELFLNDNYFDINGFEFFKAILIPRYAL
ncbi:hypothetical protein ACJX0J_035122 [Zea mays]